MDDVIVFTKDEVVLMAEFLAALALQGVKFHCSRESKYEGHLEFYIRIR